MSITANNLSIGGITTGGGSGPSSAPGGSISITSNSLTIGSVSSNGGSGAGSMYIDACGCYGAGVGGAAGTINIIFTSGSISSASANGGSNGGRNFGGKGGTIGINSVSGSISSASANGGSGGGFCWYTACGGGGTAGTINIYASSLGSVSSAGGTGAGQPTPAYTVSPNGNSGPVTVNVSASFDGSVTAGSLSLLTNKIKISGSVYSAYIRYCSELAGNNFNSLVVNGIAGGGDIKVGGYDYCVPATLQTLGVPTGPQPTLLSVQGMVKKKVTGAPSVALSSGSLQVSIKNETGTTVWGPFPFNGAVASGKFSITLGAANVLNLIPNKIHTMTISVSDKTSYLCPTCDSFDVQFTS